MAQPIHANIHCEIVGKVKSITVSLSKTGKYYAVILSDDGVDVPEPVQTIEAVTGIDLGLSHYAIQSNGEKVAYPRFIKRAEAITSGVSNGNWLARKKAAQTEQKRAYWLRNATKKPPMNAQIFSTNFLELSLTKTKR